MAGAEMCREEFRVCLQNPTSWPGPLHPVLAQNSEETKNSEFKP